MNTNKIQRAKYRLTWILHLDYKRSNNECIDFKMMPVYFIFGTVYSKNSRNNDSIFNFIIFFGGKMNLVGVKI